MAIRKIVHGRQSSATPIGEDGLLMVVFYGEGPIPNYDIAGWEQDKPIGKYPIQRTKLSRDYNEHVDAFWALQKELSKKTVSRKRGCICALKDDATAKWALWIEVWEDYFSRSHILKSPESVERQVAQDKAVVDLELSHKLKKLAEERDAYLRKPSTWIFLVSLGLIVVWQFVRWLISQ